MGSGLLKKKNTGVWEGDSALLTAAVKVNAESVTILQYYNITILRRINHRLLYVTLRKIGYCAQALEIKFHRHSTVLKPNS
jgi:hypothetical protein